ncbi:MAG: 4Fe-4S dicluster domain-containing protein [Planctomycetes bacterium]|nr:4Fe-4S dicluster domain-containing protein [Planctomycetota bacterium]
MKIIRGSKDIKVDSSFAEEIAKRSGENVFLCYQCKKCASGCPSRMFMDSTPTELMRYIQLGMVDEAMKGNTIWYCLSCQTCSVRCPQDIDIAHVVDTIKIIVQEKKIKADTKNVRLFNRFWMTMLKYMGRMYEVGLAGGVNLLTGHPFKDMALAMKMFKKGKLKLLPSIKKPFETMKMFSRAKRLKK